MSNWQSIDTLPIKPPPFRFDVWCGDVQEWTSPYRVTNCFWFKRKIHFFPDYGDDFHMEVDNPTHWMPLPEPPEVKCQQTDK